MKELLYNLIRKHKYSISIYTEEIFERRCQEEIIRSDEDNSSFVYLEFDFESLKKELPDMPVVMYDERFTSTIAHQAMIDGGMKKSDRRDKNRVDAIAATIILNDYLQSIYNQPKI